MDNYNQLNYINFSEKEISSSVYRIFSLERFLEILERKCLTLVSPAAWEDPFENFIYHYFKKQYPGPNRLMRWYGGNLVGQCWTQHRETDAMWRIYSPGKNGIKVRVSASSLLHSLTNSISDTSPPFNCHLGKVIYSTKKELTKLIVNPDLENNLLRNANSSYLRALYLLHKRKEFSHEKEVRLIYEFNSTSELRDESLYDIPIDPNSFFEGIVLDPRMSDTEFKMYSSGIRSLGYKGRITHSSLYKLDI